MSGRRDAHSATTEKTFPLPAHTYNMRAKAKKASTSDMHARIAIVEESLGIRIVSQPRRKIATGEASCRSALTAGPEPRPWPEQRVDPAALVETPSSEPTQGPVDLAHVNEMGERTSLEALQPPKATQEHWSGFPNLMHGAGQVLGDKNLRHDTSLQCVGMQSSRSIQGIWDQLANSTHEVVWAEFAKPMHQQTFGAGPVLEDEGLNHNTFLQFTAMQPSQFT